MTTTYSLDRPNPRWDVTQPFIEHVHVTAADVDRFGHTNNVVYIAWLERVAWSHSIWLGLDFAAYEQFDAGCVAYRTEVDYLAPTFVGDELMLGTWIQENDGRMTMWRAYQIIRASDGKTVLRGRTRFVCVDMKTGRPRMQPPEYVAAYRPAVVSPR